MHAAPAPPLCLSDGFGGEVPVLRAVEKRLEAQHLRDRAGSRVHVCHRGARVDGPVVEVVHRVRADLVARGHHLVCELGVALDLGAHHEERGAGTVGAERLQQSAAWPSRGRRRRSGRPRGAFRPLEHDIYAEVGDEDTLNGEQGVPGV